MSSPDRRIDPSKLKTDAGREFAAQIEAITQQNGRVAVVLDEYHEYSRGFQLDLAEAAIACAVSSLGFHDSRSVCQDHFHALIDCMFVYSSVAEATLSENECERMYNAAAAVRKILILRLGEIHDSSLKDLRQLREENARRIMAQALHNVRLRYMAYASVAHLRELICRCLATSAAMDVSWFSVKWNFLGRALAS